MASALERTTRAQRWISGIVMALMTFCTTLPKIATKAFRRPVDEPTLNRLVALAESVYTQPGRTFEAGVAQAMADVAALTGGKATRAGDRKGLDGLTAELDQLEPALGPSFRYERHQELSPWLLGVALFVFLMSWTLQETWLRILPARAL